MGYESKIYLVESHNAAHLTGGFLKDDYTRDHLRDEKGELVPGPQGRYCSVIAMIDLCKCGYDAPVSTVISEAIKAQKAVLASEAKPAPFGLYQGEDFVVEDPYGDPLAPIDLDDLIAALETEVAGEYAYRRFTLALGMLKTFRDLRADYPSTFVLHYGH